MHVATHGRWEQVVAEQLARIRSSGLYDRMTRLFVGVVGPSCQSFSPADEKIEVVHRSPDLQEYEFPTLNYVRSFCQSNDGFVFYIHTKGIFRDTEMSTDWRRYMEYFLIERHEDCLGILAHSDVCGVNWQLVPWPHFSGNFWWARAQYVATLPALDTSEPVVAGWNLGERHHCERWVCSGPEVRVSSLHQTHLNHYASRYPRAAYEGPTEVQQGRPRRVALVYDDVVRRDTTGTYCLRAMRHFAQASHYLPCETCCIPAGYFDLILFVDDGLDYEIPAHLRPSALWAIDTHLNPQRIVTRAKDVDFVFAAQRDGVELLRRHGINCVGWLPLACDPQIHQKFESAKELDVCFVGHLCTPQRKALAERVLHRFPRSFVGQRFFYEMAETYCSSRIVLNLSVRNDINMRVFEALACGSLLLTNDLAENGLDKLLTDGQHLVTYDDLDDLMEKIEHYLKDDEARERIAAAGREEALARHTYVHRMGALLDTVAAESRTARPAAPAPQPDPPIEALTSIIIVTCNALEYTRACLESIERCTPQPHEVIVVDNGSSDGTRDDLRRRLSVRLIENRDNRGFPAAANQGLRASRGEQLLLLNNDVIVTPGWLERLTRALQSGPDVGLAGPRSNEVSGPQRVATAYTTRAEMEAFVEDWQTRHHGQRLDAERLVGFCLLVRREVVERIGLLDERFGIGNFEDDDYCHRARLAGFRAVIARDCFVHHFGSATFKSSGADYAAIIKRNQDLFLEKWQGTDHDNRPAGEDVDPGTQIIRVSSKEPIVSLCMIARDSARTLRPCLQSVRPWVDEIIVVDTGSTDQTAQIAREVGATVRHFPWRDDFAAARNESLSSARGRWLFWMDSDDTIDPENGWKLRTLVTGDHPQQILGFVLQVHCPGGREQGPYSTATVVDHVKVFRNHPEIRFCGRIHEQVLPAIRRLGGDIGWTDIFVTHSGSDQSEEGRVRKQRRDLRILETELGEDPDHTFALFNMGMTLLDMGRAEEALNPLCRSLQLAGPGESHIRKIYALLAQAYSQLGRRQTALKTCGQGLEVCPGDSELLFRSGTLLQQLGHLDEAERCFHEVIEPKRDRYFSSLDQGMLGIKAWHNLALLYQQRRQFDRSTAAWRHVLDYDRSNPAAWRGLLDVLTAARDAAGLEQISSPQPDQPVPQGIRVLARARLAAQHGNPRAAVCELEQAANGHPSLELLNEMCELAFTHELFDVAERGLEQLTRRAPQDPSACYNRALVHLRLGNYDQAMQWADRSKELRPNHAPSTQLLEQARRLAQANGAAGADLPRQNVRIGDSLIGDALFTEPAIRALAAAQGRRVPVLLNGTPRALFRDHPNVLLVKSESQAQGDWVQLDPMAALRFARTHGCHICAGFFVQLGLDPAAADHKPRLWREGLEPESPPPRNQRNGRIALAPFSASCMVHRTGVANKTIALDWWNELARRLPLPSDSFGAAHEPHVEEATENFRGMPLDEVAGWLRRYELLITTDNGLSAIAGALNCDIVLLESASSPWLTGPQTSGRLEVVCSTAPAWTHDEVIAAVQRILGPPVPHPELA